MPSGGKTALTHCVSSVQAGPGAGLEGGDLPSVAGTPGAAGEWAALRRLRRTQAAGLQSQAGRLLPSSRVKAWGQAADIWSA